MYIKILVSFLITSIIILVFIEIKMKHISKKQLKALIMVRDYLLDHVGEVDLFTIDEYYNESLYKDSHFIINPHYFGSVFKPEYRFIEEYFNENYRIAKIN